MRTDIQVRAATPGDESFLRELFARTRTFPMNGPEFRSLADVQFYARQISYTARCNQQPEIIEVNGVSVGSVWVWRSAGEMRIADIAVDPAFQGRGIGREVLTSLIEEAARMRVPLRLTVATGNERASRFYAGLGFVTIGAASTDLELELQPRSNVMV